MSTNTVAFWPLFGAAAAAAASAAAVAAAAAAAATTAGPSDRHARAVDAGGDVDLPLPP